MADDVLIPATLDEALAALDTIVPFPDQLLLRKGEATPIELHHSLGQHIRNRWRLWENSILAQHMRDVHGIDHPDDMSGRIIELWAQRLRPTSWKRVLDSK